MHNQENWYVWEKTSRSLLHTFTFNLSWKKQMKKINSIQNTSGYIKGSSDLHFQGWLIRRPPVSIWKFLFLPVYLSKKLCIFASPRVLSFFGLLYITLKINSTTLSKLTLLGSKDESLFIISFFSTLFWSFHT